MNKNNRKRLPIGHVGSANREVVGYNESRSEIYVVRCLSCGYTKNGAAKTLQTPCKKCSYRYTKDLQDLREQIYFKYKYNANSKGLPFEIDFEEFKSLIAKNCFYCGQEPSRVWKSRRKENNTVTYNGIDRMINDKGYIAGNYVTCCSECNYIKRDRSLDSFKKMVKLWSERVDQW